MTRYGTFAVLALALAAFAAQALAISAQREQPRYDEVQYLSLAREYQREGGVVATMKCHVEGRCKEDNRHPFFELVLQPFTHDGPGFYADAKLVTLATAFLVMLVAFLWIRPVFSNEVALGTVVALSLSTMLAELAAGLLADVLLAAIVSLAVYLIARCHHGGPLTWLAAGSVIGLAWLTKGNGHLLLLPLAAIGLHRAGLRILLKPLPYLAAIGFVAVGFFLLYRNAVVYDSPLHNVNAKALWLDDWSEIWTTQRSGEWPRVGFLWYLERHSLWELAVRAVKGLGETSAVFTYVAGFGASADVPGVGPMTAAVVVPRAATGFVVIALAAAGMVRRFRAGHRAEVLAVVYTLGTFFLAFALGAQGVGEVGTRFMLPFVVLVIPFAVHFVLVHAVPWLGEKLRVNASQLRLWLTLALGAGLCVKLALYVPMGIASDPRAHVKVPKAWSETSRWLGANLAGQEQFAIASNALYSTFDFPFPRADPRWPYTYQTGTALMHSHLARDRITKLLLDLEDVDRPKYQAKIDEAPKDAHGATTFVGWPRCFADSATPSRFLIFCSPAGRSPPLRP